MEHRHRLKNSLWPPSGLRPTAENTTQQKPSNNQKGFANQVTTAPPVNTASQPISKASIEVLQPLLVQKETLKSEKAKSPIPTINITVFSFDFSSRF
jgi:hypothetical protein